MNISNLICNTYIEKKFSSENITQWAHLMHEEKNIMNKKKIQLHNSFFPHLLYAKRKLLKNVSMCFIFVQRVQMELSFERVLVVKFVFSFALSVNV
jgi:hypothetical protein